MLPNKPRQPTADLLGVHSLHGGWGLWSVRFATRIRLMTNSKIDLEHLTAEERLNLIGQIWDSLQAEDVPVTDEQKAELDRRIEEMDGDGKRGIPWEEVMDRIRGRSE